MRSTALILMALALSSLTAATLTAPRVFATHGSDAWAPYGPIEDRIRIQIYANEDEEFRALQRNEIDITDWPLSPSWIDTFKQPGSGVHMQSFAEIGMFQIDFNHIMPFWGVQMNSVEGRNIRQAIAHLIDKDEFISTQLQGFGQRLDNPVPPALGGWVFNDTKRFDLLHPNTISAYNIAPGAAPGSPDFCAARDHLVLAGFSDTDGDCDIDTLVTSQIDFYIRSDDLQRLALGNLISAQIEALFNGQNVVNELRLPRGSIVNIVIKASPPNDWHMYTGGWLLSRDPDYLYDLFNGRFASNTCGGPSITFPLNYILYCNAAFDTYSAQLKFAPDLTVADAAAKQAQLVFGQTVGDIPVWAGAGFEGYREGWTGVINEQGFGINSWYSFLNMYNPNPVEPGLIRYGFKSDTDFINVYWSTFYWDYEILLKVYDSLLSYNPLNIQEDYAGMATNWQINPVLGYVPPTGTAVTLRFTLQHFLRWHDGLPLTAEDVKFTILTYRDLPAPIFRANVANVIDVTVVSPLTADVHLNVNSAFALHWIGGLPIVPKHIWDTNSDGLLDGDKSGLDYDTVLNRALIGSGAWKFVSSSSGTSSPGIGGSFLLERFSVNGPTRAERYFRSVRNFVEWDWSEYDNDGETSIFDIARIAQCYLKSVSSPTAACPNPAYWDFNKNGIVDIADVSRAASWYRIRWVFPQAWPWPTPLPPPPIIPP